MPEKNPQTVGTSYENMSKSSNFRSVGDEPVDVLYAWSVRERKGTPGGYQGHDLFIKVLSVLCPNRSVAVERRERR